MPMSADCYPIEGGPVRLARPPARGYRATLYGREGERLDAGADPCRRRPHRSKRLQPLVMNLRDAGTAAPSIRNNLTSGARRS